MEADQSDNLIPPACPNCAARDRKIAELEARLATLEAAARAGKRQAAPFSKGPPKPQPKRPGRKRGEDYGTHQRRAIPERIDETLEATLPEHCPACGGAVEETAVAQQYQTEIPRVVIHRQFNVHVGRCLCCRRRVQGRHGLQTSDALGAAASQVGPDAQALAVTLNKDAGLSHGKIRSFFTAAFDLTIARATPCRIMLRCARRLGDVHQTILRRVRSSLTLVPDETGWRIGGVPAWLHVAVGLDATAYLIDRRRGYDAAVQLIGAAYAGHMTHDGWKPYDRFLLAIHQTCLGHLLRRCHELLENARGGAVRFPREVKAVLQDALAIRDQRDAGLLTVPQVAAHADRLSAHMGDLVCRPRASAPLQRLSDHLWNHRNHLFAFLLTPGVDATNHRAEQAIRPAVVNRKVWGGNRTPAGAEAQSILMSVLRTATQQGLAAIDFLSQTLRSRRGLGPRLFADTG
jgi:transposase